MTVRQTASHTTSAHSRVLSAGRQCPPITVCVRPFPRVGQLTTQGLLVTQTFTNGPCLWRPALGRGQWQAPNARRPSGGQGWPRWCPREDRAGLPSSLSFLPCEPPRSLRAIPMGCPALTQWATEWCVLHGVSPCLPPRRRFLLPVPVCRVLPELRWVALLSPSPCGKTESLASQTEGGRRGFPVHISRFPEQGMEARGCRTTRARAQAVCVWLEAWCSFASGDAGAV